MPKKTSGHAHHPTHETVALAHHHGENKGSNTGEFLSDVILGGQDGLVNTLGVILGLAAASSDFRIVVAGSLAGAIAEAVSMGAVGYTSKMAERDYYMSELAREDYEIENMPQEEIQEIREIYEKKGFKGDLLEEVVKVLTSNKKVWLHTMMREELGLTPVQDGRPLKAAIVIGLASFVGAAIPLIPFLVFYLAKWRFDGAMTTAVGVALGVSALILFIVGAIKSKLTVGKWYKSGTQMLVIGILSALIGYLIGLAFQVPVA